MLLKFNRKPCTERHCLICTLAHRRPPQWWRYTGVLQAAAKHVDAFIAPSRFSQKLHEAALNIPTVYLPNFVPSSDVAFPVDKESATREPYFLFVGRLERLKGLQTLIPVFRRYQKAQLWIAGAGHYKARLRQLAGEVGMYGFWDIAHSRSCRAYTETLSLSSCHRFTMKFFLWSSSKRSDNKHPSS